MYIRRKNYKETNKKGSYLAQAQTICKSLSHLTHNFIKNPSICRDKYVIQLAIDMSSHICYFHRKVNMDFCKSVREESTSFQSKMLTKLK